MSFVASADAATTMVIPSPPQTPSQPKLLTPNHSSRDLSSLPKWMNCAPDQAKIVEYARQLGQAEFFDRNLFPKFDQESIQCLLNDASTYFQSEHPSIMVACEHPLDTLLPLTRDTYMTL